MQYRGAPTTDEFTRGLRSAGDERNVMQLQWHAIGDRKVVNEE